ncbi:MAG: HrpE/YscL family type III secretion apparatus protein [Puniceicoccales bacterium]|jgi:type III secretion protein L|nr:HrpE/YscL family type III secretion apparatus protein [Puniceicoccales bacterium]
MLHISREKFQLLPEKKVLKREDYCAYLEANNAIQHAYRENDRLINYASGLCGKLVQDTNAQVTALVESANEHARELIDRANQESAQIIAAANAKSKAILDEALEKRNEIFEEAKRYYENEAKRGYADGYATGKAKMAQQLVEIAAKNSENFKQLEGSIVGLVLKALQRIMGDLDKRELIVGVVRQALKTVKNQREATLKVSPQDSQTVRDHLEEILADGAVDYLEVTADSRLKAGTCILETDVGVVDASLDVQLESIGNAFKKITAGNTSEEAEKSTEAVGEKGESIVLKEETKASEETDDMADDEVDEDDSEVDDEDDEDIDDEDGEDETQASEEVDDIGDDGGEEEDSEADDGDVDDEDEEASEDAEE